jgi:hypothetical protein
LLLLQHGGRNTGRIIVNRSKVTRVALDAQIKKVMDLQLSRLYHTLVSLRFIQVLYRIKYRFVKPKRVELLSDGVFTQLDLVDSPKKQTSLYIEGATWSFNFLNLNRSFSEDMKDWSFAEYGMLWTYNLNYFDWLHQLGMSKEVGLATLRKYYSIHAINNNIILHPYPTSIRIINIAKFVSKWNIKEKWLFHELESDLKLLSGRLEYHLLANHLLENAFALYVGGLTTKREEFIGKGKKLLIRELKKQVLNDGMHYERSPMYHLIILERLLDSLNFAKSTKDNLEPELGFYAIKMTRLTMIWKDLDRVPMMQDSAYGIALSVPSILEYSNKLLGDHYPATVNHLGDSGYRIINSDNFSLFANVASLGPSYQPGHAHADELNFELFYRGAPVIVDTGVSTYEKNQRRQFERSTESHNCIVINDINSSDVWSGFRVGKRAKVQLIQDDGTITAQHFGYYPIIVKRSWQLLDGTIVITDELKNIPKSLEGRGKLHFHPDIKIERIDKNTLVLSNHLVVKFESSSETIDVSVGQYKYAKGYNCLITAKVITYNCKASIRITISEVS